MKPYSSPPALAHAITDCAGHFLNVDDRFCEILQRKRGDIVGRTILEVTADPFRPMNAEKLDKLRDTGKPFVIQKNYLRADGSTQRVENSVSLLKDGTRGPLLAASIKALPSNEAERFAASIDTAKELLNEQILRAGLGPHYQDRDWRLLLAAYLREMEGQNVSTDHLCSIVGGDPRANLLRVWELVKEGALTLEGQPNSIELASVRVSAPNADLIERHLATLTNGQFR